MKPINEPQERTINKAFIIVLMLFAIAIIGANIYIQFL